MMTYSKYTNGEAFTLNGSDYIGPFHIKDNIPYTERYPKSDSVVLTSKNTFINKMFVNEMENDTTYKNIGKLSPYFTNVLDIFNKQGLESAFGAVDDNNLTTYINLILGNPTVYNFEENYGFFYGLSSVNDTPTGKNTHLNIEPFSNNPSYSFLDNMKSGTFVVDSDENFKYICSDGVNNYTLSGNFNYPDIPLGIVNVANLDSGVDRDYTHSITNDPDNQRILFVNNDYISIYDSSNYDECGNLPLIDRIALTKTATSEFVWSKTHIKWSDMRHKWTTRYYTSNSNNPEFIKFGKNIRTSISGLILSLYNKYTSDAYTIIDLSKYNVSEVLTIGIDDIDDRMILVHRVDGKLNLLFIDSENIEGIYNVVIKSINTTAPKYTIEFSKIDSNTFHIYTDTEHQTRYVSNPTYPSGRLERCDLLYEKSHPWNQTHQQWSKMKVKWNPFKYKSNKFNNLVTSEVVKYNNMYMILHNVGRIYVIHQPLPKRYHHSVPLELDRSFAGVNCSESAMGLYFNASISNLVKDTINIFNKSSGSYDIHEYYMTERALNDFIYNADNLYINTNEVINAITIQRIFTLIFEMQTKLTPISIEN